MIKQLLSTLGQFFSKTFFKLFGLVKKTSPVAVYVVNQVKKVTEGKADNFVVDAINFGPLTSAHRFIEENIDDIAFKTAVFSGILNSGDDINKTIDDIAKKVQEFNPELRSNFWVRLAAEINIALEDGKISLSEAIAATQIAFQAYKEGKS